MFEEELTRINKQIRVYHKRIEVIKRRKEHLIFMEKIRAYDEVQPHIHMVNDFEDDSMHKVLS